MDDPPKPAIKCWSCPGYAHPAQLLRRPLIPERFRQDPRHRAVLARMYRRHPHIWRERHFCERCARAMANLDQRHDDPEGWLRSLEPLRFGRGMFPTRGPGCSRKPIPFHPIAPLECFFCKQPVTEQDIREGRVNIHHVDPWRFSHAPTYPLASQNLVYACSTTCHRHFHLLEGAETDRRRFIARWGPHSPYPFGEGLFTTRSFMELQAEFHHRAAT